MGHAECLYMSVCKKMHSLCIHVNTHTHTHTHTYIYIYIYILVKNLHPQIKFAMEHSSKELPFLDILTKNVNGTSLQISTTN